jgi:hypothetical protein
MLWHEKTPTNLQNLCTKIDNHIKDGDGYAPSYCVKWVGLTVERTHHNTLHYSKYSGNWNQKGARIA